MSVKDEIIMYDPILCKENELFKKFDINQKFQSCIDLKDVALCQIIKLPNETAMYVDSEEE